MRAGICTLALLCFAAPSFARDGARTAPRPSPLFSNLPLLFVENRGQLAETVRFSVPGSGRTLYFTREGITVALEGDGRRWALKLDFVNANPDVVLRGEEAQQAIFSYFQGNDPEKWQAGCPTYARILYEDLWPGIDLVYRGEVNRLKHEFAVAPGADPRRIRFEFRGATDVRLDGEGDLVLETPLGSFEDARPVAYQMRDGERIEVDAAFALEGTRVGFMLGAFDATCPLVLDPETIVYSGFLGGSSTDTGVEIAVDAAGAAYVTGATQSADFPTAGGLDPSFNGGLLDAFVAKIDATGDALLFSGFLGGSSIDFSNGIAVDAAGAAYMTGGTRSSDFPAVGGLGSSYNGGYYDAFVAKVDPTGTALVYSGLVGGSWTDNGTGIAVDTDGAAYVQGLTGSRDFPVVGNLGPSFNGGPLDAFVMKVNRTGDALAYSGFLGGSGEDCGLGIAVDLSGAAYLTGYTDSVDFPTVGGLGPIHDNGRYNTFADFDAYVAKVDPSGSMLVYSGCLGGTSGEFGWDIAVDASGAAYVTGTTASSDFPTVGGLDPSFHGGSLDAFVAKIDSTGDAILFSGFLGGSNSEEGRGIAVDGSGAVYLTGLTASADFPVLGGLDASYNGGASDAFVAKVSPAGTALVFSGFLGGSDSDEGTSIAVGPEGFAYATGWTDSTDFPTMGGLGPSYNGSRDAFVTKIDVPDFLICRSGTLGVATGPLPPVVLRINGSEGDAARVVVATIGSPLVVTMDAPPLGPTPAPFAMYGWVGEPNASTVTPHPKGVGTMCFPTPVTGGLPQPNRVWNNIGHPAILGYPHFPSEPAPSTPLSKAWGIPFAVTATFQGFIFDDGSGASHPVSLTNAVILRVIP